MELGHRRVVMLRSLIVLSFAFVPVCVTAFPPAFSLPGSGMFAVQVVLLHAAVW